MRGGGGFGRGFREGNENDAFFFISVPCVLEGFFVYCFEVGEVALVVEGFAELI